MKDVGAVKISEALGETAAIGGCVPSPDDILTTATSLSKDLLSLMVKFVLFTKAQMSKVTRTAVPKCRMVDTEGKVKVISE